MEHGNGISLKFRLGASLAAVVTVFLLLFGAGEIARISAEQEQRLQTTSSAVLARLETSLPGPIWDFATKSINEILRGEMAEPLVTRIVVAAQDGAFVAGVMRDARGEATVLEAEAADARSIAAVENDWQRTLYHDDAGQRQTVGTVSLILDRDVVAAHKRAAVTRVITAVIVLNVVMIVALTLLINALVIRPIAAITHPIAAISQGDLRPRVLWTSNDEFGALAREINTFLARVTQVLVEVRGAAQGFIASTTDSERTIELLLQQTKRQQTDLDALSSNLRTLSESARNVAGYTVDSTSSVSRMDGHSKNGIQRAEAANAASQAFMGKMADAGGVIAQLDQFVAQISGIVDEIKGIADQTNLLALNAAIEAARAGEQGRGFAVVADEVRGLSQRTQGATSRVQGMIEQLQSQATLAVRSIEEGRKKAVENANLISDASGAFSDIAGAVQASLELTQRIAVAAEEQSTTLDEISAKVHSVLDVHTKTVQVAHDTQSASEQIHATSSHLQDVVSRFQLDARV